MRFLPLLLAWVFAAGCGVTSNAGEDPGGGDGSGSGEDIADCNQDSDCALAGTDCCACPSYAIPVSDPAHAACEDVPCQTETCPVDQQQDVRAACNQGACVLTCAVMTCTQTCDGGFALDANGCLTCACADTSGPAECMLDTDCTRVEADCCGCALGGTDTAVPNGEVASHQQQLDCPMNPQCPGVDTCATGLAPACVQGACALLLAAPLDACTGPTCPDGQACELNVDQNATDHGVGVCATPP